MKVFAAISKVEDNADGTITVEGTASSESVDMDGEVVKAAAIEAALPEFMRYGTGNLREMHQPLAAGTVDEITVADGVTKIVGKVVDPVAITKVKTQVYKGFSIGGKVTARDDLNKKHVTGLKLVEISLVDRPANPDAVISMWKAEELDETDETAKAETPAAPTNMGTDFKQVWQSERDGSIHVKKADLVAHHKTLDDAAALQAVAGSALEKLGEIEASLAGEKMSEGDAEKTAAVEDVEKRSFTAAERREAASAGTAMKDGSYPIENKDDLDNAIRAFGRAKNKPATKRHIIRRAKALGATDKLPEDWRGSTKKAEAGGDLAKGVTLYGLAGMLELLASLQYAEERFENNEFWDSGVDVPDALKTRFGAVLVDFADIVADALEVLLGAMTKEEADEALERAAAPTDLQKGAKTDDELAKVIADRDIFKTDRDTFKAAFEVVSGKLDTLAPQIADMAKRLKEVEEQPMPPKTAGTRAVSKESDAAGDAEPVISKAVARKLLDAMSPEDRAVALIKIAHENPIQMKPRG